MTKVSRNLNNVRRKKIKDELIVKYNGVCQGCGIDTNSDDYIVKNGDPTRKVLGPTYPTIEHTTPYYKCKSYSEEYITLYCFKCNQDHQTEHSRNASTDKRYDYTRRKQDYDELHPRIRISDYPDFYDRH